MHFNILTIFLDDHARWATGCYGNPDVRTPTIDYLAKTGVVMDNAFTPTPVCSPSRASFFTGEIPSQHGVHDYLNTWDPAVNKRDWLAGHETLAQIFQRNGYTTALCGKWHLGRSFECQAGFDYWYEAGDTRVENETLLGPWPEAGRRPQRYDPHAITDRAVQFLRCRDPDKPFFLFAGYFATHSPWSGHNERLVAGYRDRPLEDFSNDPVYPFGRMAAESLMPARRDPHEALAQYYAAATEVDEQVGRLIDELETQSLRDTTLVIYTSDHGLNMGHHGIWGKGNGTKPYNMLEESIRVPLILNQPGFLLGGQRRSEMVNHCDLFETLLEYSQADGRSAGDGAKPGRSFMPLMRGKWAGNWRTTIFGEYGTVRMARTERYKLIVRYPEEQCQLFDLDQDDREMRDLSPDPGYAEVVRRLRDELEAYFRTYEDPSCSGLRVAELPSYNKEEVWRYPDGDDVWWEAL